MGNKKVIMYDSPEAAEKKTVTGWFSRDGRFWGKDESMARYSGCTHKKCECGGITERGYTYCKVCRGKRHVQAYMARPYKDIEYPVYSDALDKYFFSEDDLIDYCFDEEVDTHDLMLIICQENRYTHIGFSQWDDIMPEDSDGDLPQSLLDAIKACNEVIDKLPPASYGPGKYRTTFPHPELLKQPTP